MIEAAKKMCQIEKICHYWKKNFGQFCQISWNQNYNNILNVFLTNFRVIRQSHDLNIYKVWVSIIIPKSNVVNIPLWEPNSM